ncbi:hypothetical protein RMSM_01312 [Rhodopirellula maiorica SM1]|uniref:Uncharacterized protein n=1 Tax=Rhodopirellula maiorica SM1 TaxID=1265738 RepID=M5S299_9BACT|nr:hypothetical protein RMSM_01312 [Rhodopirellula maiorica SM1]
MQRIKAAHLFSLDVGHRGNERFFSQRHKSAIDALAGRLPRRPTVHSARGRNAPREAIEDFLSNRLAVIDLDSTRPTAAELYGTK